MKSKKLCSVVLACAMALSLFTGCRRNDPIPEGSNPPAGSSSADQSQPSDGSVTAEAVDFVVLSGPTGVGAAKLMADNEAGTTKNVYDITVAAANDEVTALLANGEADIAAIATIVASNIYTKTNGSIQMLALNTLGVLYILEKGDRVQSIADLAGKTIYATGQGANPEYILNYLLTENGLTPGENVTIQWMTAQEVTAQMASGSDGICMLPVPAATALLLKDSNVRQAVDLSVEWEQTSGSALPMGCVVVRSEFLEQNPQAVADFLSDYQSSLAYISDPENLDKEGDDSAPALVARYAITPSAAIAKAAIPQCNLTFITGESMQDTIQSYYEVLFQANPASIGGSMPYDDFYYVP